MPKPNSTTKKIEVFRPGTFTAMGGVNFSVTADELIDLAARYDREANPVPVVIGHPKTDTPAYGWVKDFSFEDNRLIAEIDQLEPQFADQVAEGRYKKISMSFYGKGSTANPAGDQLYPKHVGFLGGMAPAVSDLKPVQFSEDENDITIEFGDPANKDIARLFRKLREWLIAKEGVETADDVLSDWHINWIDDAGNETKPTSFSENNEDEPMGDKPDDKANEFAAREKDLNDREKRLADQEAKNLGDANLAFADGLVSDAKIPSSTKDQVVAMLNGLGNQAGDPISFADNETSLLDLTKDFLTKLPKIVEFGETDLGDGDEDTDNSPRAIANAARAYQFAQGEKGVTVSTSDAVAHVQKKRGITD